MEILIAIKVCNSVHYVKKAVSSVQLLSHVRLMDFSTTGFPVHYQLLELAQTHVHQVSDATQQSHPLSSPSPPASNISHHQGLYQWVSSPHQVAKVSEFQHQHQSFQWILRTDWVLLGLTGLMSLQFKQYTYLNKNYLLLKMLTIIWASIKIIKKNLKSFDNYKNVTQRYKESKWESSIEAYALPCIKLYGQWKFSVWCREFRSDALWPPRRVGWGGR